MQHFYISIPINFSFQWISLAQKFKGVQTIIMLRAKNQFLLQFKKSTTSQIYQKNKVRKKIVWFSGFCFMVYQSFWGI